MAKVTTAVITSFYEGVEPYLRDFFASLSAQSACTKFDLVGVNDGCSNLMEHVPRNANFGLQTLPPVGNPIENRIHTIRWAFQEGYTKLVFCDSDDVMASNRIAVSESLLEANDIAITELALWDGKDIFKDRFIASRLGGSFEVTSLDIAHYNFMGFSNTAIRADCIKSFNLVIDQDVLAGDWLFYSALLREGYRAVFSEETHTLYRRHAGNQTCLEPHSTEELKELFRVRKAHYCSLANYYTEFGDQAELALQQWKQLEASAAVIFSKDTKASPPAKNHSLFWWEIPPQNY